MDELNRLSERIIGCAIEVHRHLGPGLKEQAYEAALAVELDLQRIGFARQVSFPVEYKGRSVGRYRLDLLVEGQVVVEVKSVDKLIGLFEAQLLTYLRIAHRPLGLLINFNHRLLKEGIRRVAL